jgi:hypothetical protein
MIYRVANRNTHDDDSWKSEKENQNWLPSVIHESSSPESSNNMFSSFSLPLHYPNTPPTSGSSPTPSSPPTSKHSVDTYTQPLVPTTAAQQSYGSGGASPTSTGNAGVVNSSPTSAKSGDDSHSLTTIQLMAAVLLPLISLAILGVILFFYLRRRRRQKAQVQVREKTQTSGNYPRPHYVVPPVLSSPAGSLVAPQPVILGPIVSGSNGAYYTGIDTSDVVSMHDTTGTNNPFVDQSDPHDEAPPPYRPRSIAATISRNTSLRQTPPAALSETNLMAAHGQIPRSPFADPHDDAISEFSEPTRRRFGRRNEDELSIVSDLSYQQEPVIVRPTV